MLRDAGGTIRPDALDEVVDGAHDPRVLVGMLEQAGIVRRGYDAGRAMRIELLPVGTGAGADARRAARALCTRVGRASRPHRRVRRDARALPAPSGRRALRRDARRRRAARATCARPATARATAPDRAARRAPGRPGQGDHRRRREPHLAARTAQPRRDAPRLGQGSAVRPPLARVRLAGRRFGGGGHALGACARGRRRARRGRERRLPRAPRGRASTLPALRSAAPTAGDAGPLVDELRAWRSQRAREDGVPAYVVLHDATLHELAAATPGIAGRARGRERASDRRRSTATATSCSTPRDRLSGLNAALRGYNAARSAASTTYGGGAEARPDPKPRLLALAARALRALGRGLQLRPRDGDPQRARRSSTPSNPRGDVDTVLYRARTVRPAPGARDPARRREPRARRSPTRSPRS